MKSTFERFKDAKVVVVGDVMLDSYVYGDSTRRSPEAPVLILKEEREDFNLGGAANVAQNIAALGGDVTLFGYVGKDRAGRILRRKLVEAGVKPELSTILGKTTQKVRLMGDTQHQMLRLDREEAARAQVQFENEIAKKVASLKPRCIIASDYAKGTLSPHLMAMLKMETVSVPILVDPKPANMGNYQGAYLITPNASEARQMMPGVDNADDLLRKLKEKVLCDHILMTRGEEGMSLLEDYKITHIPTKARAVYDVTGAGDTVIAVTGLGIAAGLSLQEAATLSNYAAGIVVGKRGTATVSRSELEEAVNAK